MNSDTVFVRVGAVLGGAGFVLLFVEAARVIFGKTTLNGIDSVLPWVGLGVLIVGATLLALAVSVNDEAAESASGSADRPGGAEGAL